MIERSTQALLQLRRQVVSAMRQLTAGIHRDLQTRWTVLRSRRTPRPRPRHLVPGLGVRDLETILVAARHFGGPYGSLDGTLIETGATSRRLREGELLALRWGDIDWAEGTVNVERVLREMARVRPKCGGARKVRLAPHMRLTLLRHRASLAAHGSEDLVFPDPKRGGFLDVRSLRCRLGTACRRAGFRAITFGHLSMAFKAPWWSRYL
jgi:integrase